ncbi:MAG: N-acyl-L-amino acid amidohydrolase [uncultured Thermomicrobiales bacterium]|uniref:Peptidase M20 domain-containing protein 2 n=1 Tax=uncultured Thermomicrobiales bacterium TaxID=1645740 RepID=A0A6J4VTE9_9BACT|nr:MAG: N-acyl-L-amino acid amidohydrolase [uncultured Thermomicrobiales bacterium]
MDELRRAVAGAIDEHGPGIIDVADQIHARPEIGFQEHFASQLMADALRALGYEVEKPVGGLETAFRATKRGKGPGPTIAVLAEYDALAGIGHGCGHNLIAGAALGAAVGLREVIDRLDGVVQIIGTPAEEGGGGKAILADAGVFAGVDAALMVHHAGPHTGAATSYPGDTCLAVSSLSFAFHGKPAHAAADPYNGANALNGVIKLFTGIDALRQHIKADARIHGIITHGGDAPNVTPHFARAHFFVRAADQAYLETLEEKVRKVAEGAALMTETTVEIVREGPTCLDMRPSYVLGRAYEENMRRAGLRLNPTDQRTRGSYSTDFGNISYLVPAVTGHFAISHEEIPGHSQQVVDASRSDFGHEQLLKVSTAMALTALDLFTDPATLAAARDEHARWGELYEGK